MAKIIDTTLREGNQSPNVRFSAEQSVVIAQFLNKMGIEMVEIGHPSASLFEMDRVKKVVKAIHPCPVLSHARALEIDIRAVAESGARWVGIFAGINELSQKFRLNGRTKEEILVLIKNSVTVAKQLGLSVRYTVEDASRTPDDLVLMAYETALNAGADRICFADTVGVLEPHETRLRIQKIKQAFPLASIEVHFHDDRGLALSNSLSAIDAGAEWVSSSVNGLGERCGITDTCSLLLNLRYREGRSVDLLNPLQEISDLISQISQSPPDVRRPVVGKYAFTHTAKLHRDAAQKQPSVYAWIPCN